MSKHLSLAVVRQLIMRKLHRLPCRSVSKDLQLNRKTVDKYYKLFEGHDLASLMDLDDLSLSKTVYNQTLKTTARPKKEMEITAQSTYYDHEQKRTGVTKKVLYEEYSNGKQKKDIYSYATFCRKLNQNRSIDTSYHKRYVPGEILMIDFAGDKVSYVDKTTGELIFCVVYVAVLAFSNYTYVEVLPNASTPYLIQALNNTLSFIQGVPITVLTDNMKQLVTAPNRYEPKLTDAAIQWGNHNKTMIQACKVASPREKSPVEGHVKLTYQRIYAPLRDVTFYSLEDMQKAFMRKLREHNMQNFQGRTYSRLDQFEREELKLLQPLPDIPFVMKDFAILKVNKNYHILLGEERHYYSVPFVYVDQTVQVSFDSRTVEIYHEMVRIAIHQRGTTPYGYTTIKDHMPENDMQYDQAYGYSTQDFKNQAAEIGPDTEAFINAMLKSRLHEQHAYSGCTGVLRMGKPESFGAKRLERACSIGLQLQDYRYKTIENLLKNGVDRRTEQGDGNTNNDNHENLRGPEAF
jgi:transposase